MVTGDRSSDSHCCCSVSASFFFFSFFFSGLDNNENDKEEPIETEAAEKGTREASLSMSRRKKTRENHCRKSEKLKR